MPTGRFSFHNASGRWTKTEINKILKRNTEINANISGNLIYEGLYPQSVPKGTTVNNDFGTSSLPQKEYKDSFLRVITENNFRWIKVIKAKENVGYLDNWGLRICMAREEPDGQD